MNPEEMSRPELIRYVRELQKQIIILHELLIKYGTDTKTGS